MIAILCLSFILFLRDIRDLINDNENTSYISTSLLILCIIKLILDHIIK